MKIGILQTGLAPEQLAPQSGEYPQMFMGLLADQGFEFETFSVVQDVFPQSPQDADGWLLTGSRHGVYEDLPWIHRLRDLVRQIYAAGVPMVGICFGHQIIAQALGGRVEKYSDGWAVGALEYDFDGATRRLHAWHQDQVIEPPETATVVARNAFCQNAALLYGNRAYTVQAHPEYDAQFLGGLIDTRGRGLVPEDQLATARAGLGQPVDNSILAAEIGHFFRTGALS